MQNSTNMRILELLRFLYARTDENHPATVSDIIAHLNVKGIQAVRQTVYADTNTLIDAGIDIVVVKSTQNQYFMGSRPFEYPELKMLTDAVASSKIISAKKSEELVQKLCRLTSTHQAEQLQKFAALSSRVKPHNEKVYYIIDNIQTAIGNHQQIRFQYYEYTQEKKKILKHDGYYYVVNPYALEWKNDHYYLIGFSLKHQKIAHFRVDRLTSVENLETYFMPIEGFDVASYTNKMVDMFTSESSKEVTLLCENELMRVIIDHYGEDAAVDRYADMVYRIALSYLRSPQEAEDVVQTVFLKLLEGGMIVYPGKERAFLTKVTINHCKNLLTAAKKHEAIPLDEAVLLIQPEDRDIFYAVMELPEKYRAVVSLHYFEGYSFREISEFLHIGISAVSMRLHRAKNILKKQLGRD